MPGRLGPRFALEAVFLIALAVAMGLADLTATAIIVVMAVAWLLVAVVEWLASRDAEQVWARERARDRWQEQASEPVTELVPPPRGDEADEDTGAPLATADELRPRRKWFRRADGAEERRAER